MGSRWKMEDGRWKMKRLVAGKWTDARDKYSSISCTTLLEMLTSPWDSEANSSPRYKSQGEYPY